MSQQTTSALKHLPTSVGRRAFLKGSVAIGGGLLINFSWLASDIVNAAEAASLPDSWFELNAFIKITADGVVTASVPNPEFGQNLMTSMPMILAEELDVDWQDIRAEQAPFDPKRYNRQFSGGSQSIRQAWQSLRLAGAGARHMLRMAAATNWQVPLDEITTAQGTLHHSKTLRSATYGELASLAALQVLPAQVALKNNSDFSVVGTSRKNLVGQKIVTGQPLFGLDYQADGMLIAMIVHPPAFGMRLQSFDARRIKTMPGIVDVFSFNSMQDDYQRNYFDTSAFPTLVAIVGKSTWQVMSAKKALQIQWQAFEAYTEKMDRFGTSIDINIPAGLESTAQHQQHMQQALAGELDVLRKDGDPENAFKHAVKIVEHTYNAPYLAHNTLEPMNFFADVQGDKVKVAGPLQAPGFIVGTLAKRLNIPTENIAIEMTRMGGGFGRRAYSHYMVEAAVISQQVKAPVKLIYSREDDMTMGIYRPTYSVSLKAGLDSNNQLIAYQVRGVGFPEHCIHENRFPAGCVDNYLAEGKALLSNITTGAFRAPRSNFMASAEQAFLDEVAEAAGQDPIDFRLVLLSRASKNPVGERNDYDPQRYAGVLKLVREKSNWDTIDSSINKGVAGYFCHNSYAAHVITLGSKKGNTRVDTVTSALDCGIVVNLDSAVNMVEGAVIDGIGNAMYGEMTFTEGKPDKQNFDTYRMIRMNETPTKIDVHFVQNQIDPTGLGEPPFAPVFPALANALYRSLGKRLYQQPFAKFL